MKVPRIATRVVGFSRGEWAQIRAGALALQLSGGDAATIILPDRPELYRLDRGPDGFELRLTDEQELLETLSQEVR